MELTLVVKRRWNFGQEVIYPVCEHAKLFCDLLETKTIPQAKIGIAKRLGIEFLIDPEESKI